MTRALGLAGACAALVLSGRAHAYRTLADDPALDLSSPPTWEGPPSLELWVDLPPPTGARVYDALVRAGAVWTVPSCSRLEFEFEPTASGPAAPADGRSTVELVIDDWNAHGLHPDAGATTDVQLVHDGERWIITEADVYVDWTRPWSFEEVAADGTPSIAAALAHELGHVAGLAHPCELASGCSPDTRESLLYPVYAARPLTLSPDDEAGICALYPREECEHACPNGTRCSAGECVRTGGCANCDAGSDGCQNDADCDPTLRCSPATQTCVLPGARGAACLYASDCGSGLCLSGATPLPICTIACSDDAGCGSGERCGFADGRRVCAPAAATSDGCAVARGRGGAPASVLTVFLVLLAGRAFVRWRR